MATILASVLFAAALILAPVGLASVPNGSFDSGDLSGWDLTGTFATLVAPSGTADWGHWARDVDGAHAHGGGGDDAGGAGDGNDGDDGDSVAFGLRLSCRESKMNHQGQWWCVSGVAAPVEQTGTVGMWVRLEQDPSYFGAALIVIASDGHGNVRWVLDPTLPSRAADAPADRGHPVRAAELPMHTWHHLCLDVAGFYAEAHGRPMEAPWRLELRTYADETAAEAWVDQVTVPGCADPVRTVALDVKPGSDDNPVNTKSRGTVPVAILSEDDLDAPADVDRASLTFGATGDEASLQLRGRPGHQVPNCGAEDVDDDGLADLVCHFETQKTGLEKGDEEATLRGALTDGTPIVGTDRVRVVR